VIETDYNLQVFSGSFQQGTQNGGNSVISLMNPVQSKNINNLITDFALDGTPVKNVQYNGASYNMGGCMGCHGNAQAGGADFSFILQSGPVTRPRPLARPENRPIDSCAPAISDNTAAPGVCDGVCAAQDRGFSGRWSCGNEPAKIYLARGAGVCVCGCD